MVHGSVGRRDLAVVASRFTGGDGVGDENGFSQLLRKLAEGQL